jgi:hypothetical protein
VDFSSPSGHAVTVTIDRNAEQFIVVRDGQTWVGSYDANGDFRVVGPQGRAKVRTPMSRADAQFYARTMRSQMLAFTSPCSPRSPSGQKCLDVNQFSAPAPDQLGPFSGVPPVASHDKGCVPDIFGDPNYWASSFEDEYFTSVLSQFQFDASTQCQQMKAACNQNCGNAVTQAMVVCAGASAIPEAAAACVAGAYLGGLWCQHGCSTDYPNC